MSNITEKAQKIFERRQELEKNKNQIEHYVEKILDVFEASNSESSSLFIWQLHLFTSGKHLECKVSFSEGDEDIDTFFYKNSLTLHTPHMLLLHSMQELDALEIPVEMRDSIHEYFNEFLIKYFTVYETCGKTIIKLKKEATCEKVRFN